MSDWRFLGLIALRRLPLGLFFLVLGGAAGLTFALILPPVYRSEAVLSLEPTPIPGPPQELGVDRPAAERLLLLRERLLARDRLLDLARKHDLPEEVRDRSVDEVLRYMDRRCRVEISYGNGKPALMTLRFEAGQPDRARAVVASLLAQVRQDALAQRLGHARERLAFLDRALSSLAEQRAQGQLALRRFRMAHQGALPEDLGPLQERLAALTL
ncbi:hypothetical protein FGG78_19385, partial [Thioclava sp. BHET1]